MFGIRGLDDTINLIKKIGLEIPLVEFLKSIPYRIKNNIDHSDFSTRTGDQTWRVVHEKGYQINIIFTDEFKCRKILRVYYLENKNLKSLYSSTSTTMISYFIANKKGFNFEPAYHELYKLTQKDDKYLIDKYISLGEGYSKKRKIVTINPEQTQG